MIISDNKKLLRGTSEVLELMITLFPALAASLQLIRDSHQHVLIVVGGKWSTNRKPVYHHYNGVHRKYSDHLHVIHVRETPEGVVRLLAHELAHVAGAGECGAADIASKVGARWNEWKT